MVLDCAQQLSKQSLSTLGVVGYGASVRSFTSVLD